MPKIKCLKGHENCYMHPVRDIGILQGQSRFEYREYKADCGAIYTYDAGTGNWIAGRIE